MFELPPRRHLLATGIQAFLDLSLLTAAFVAAYLLRFDFTIPEDETRNFLTQLPLVVLLQFVALTVSGSRASIWRYTDLAHLKSFLYAAFASLAIVVGLRLGLPHNLQAWRVPLSVNFIDVVLAFGAAYAIRVVRRAEYEYKQKRVQLKKHVNGNGTGQKKRSVLQRHRVLGTTADLPQLVADLKINHVIITIAHASRHQIHRIVKICEAIPVKVRIIPELYEIIEGKVEISRIRDVEIEDLLG